MTKEELCKVRDWADTQIAEAELPSTWYQLMKLREALDAILGGFDVIPVIVPEDLPHGSRRSGGHLRLVHNDVRETARLDHES